MLGLGDGGGDVVEAHVGEGFVGGLCGGVFGGGICEGIEKG